MEANTNLNDRRLADAWAEINNFAVSGNPLEADAYRLAFADPEFMLRRETRGIRFQLELLKPDLDMAALGVEHTVVVYGSARMLSPEDAEQQLAAAHASGDEALIEQRNRLAEVEAAQAQVIASDWIPRAATELFNALGASDTRVSKALDRHWRNARTVATHNPLIYKARIVGDWSINGTEPPYIWQIGSGK